MTVTSLGVRNEYTANSGQTVFNYTFLIFSASDLNVYITSSGATANDSTDLTTAYTVDVSGIGSPAGGFITLNTGATANDLLTIVSNITNNRTTDYQSSGDFDEGTVNDDFDRTLSLVKQQLDSTGRTLAFPQSLQNATQLTLPVPVAGQYVVWNASADGLENGGAPGVVIDSDLNGTTAQMVANASLSVGDVIITTGYATAGDKGGNSFLARAVTGATADGGSLIKGVGNTAIEFVGLFADGITNVKQYGATGLGIADDTIPLQVCLDLRIRVIVPAGKYRTTAELVWSDYSSLVGEGIYNGNRHISHGNTYDPDFNSIIFYDGAGGTDSTVCRLSKLAVGVEIVTLATDDLIGPEISGLVIDANGKAEIGVYMYRTAAIKYELVAATKALKHGQLMVGTFNGLFTGMIAYANADLGITIGKDVFPTWAVSEKAINSIHIDGITSRNNGTAKAFDDSTAQQLGHGLFMTLGRGNLIENVNCETNDGAGLYLNGFGSGCGSNTIQGVYTEGNMAVAGGEGRTSNIYEAYIDADQLLATTKIVSGFFSNTSSRRIRILETTSSMQDLEQVFTLENCGARATEMVIQSTTNKYRLLNTLADYTTSGLSPLFLDNSYAIASCLFTLDTSITNVVTNGMINSADITYSGSVGIANIAFDSTLPNANYTVSCDSTSSGKRVNAINITTSGFDIQIRDKDDVLLNGFQATLTVRLIV